MKILSKILKESQRKKKFLGIRTYGSEEELWCGYVLNYSDKLIQIQHFTEYGKPDGIVVERISNIEGVDSNYKYADAIEYLYQLNYNHEKLVKEINLSNSDSWQSKTLKRFKGTDDVLSVKHEDENTYYGKVEDVDTEFVKLYTVGSIGESEGSYTMRLADIISIQIGSVESIKRNALLKRNKAIR